MYTFMNANIWVSSGIHDGIPHETHMKPICSPHATQVHPTWNPHVWHLLPICVYICYIWCIVPCNLHGSPASLLLPFLIVIACIIWYINSDMLCWISVIYNVLVLGIKLSIKMFHICAFSLTDNPLAQWWVAQILTTANFSVTQQPLRR